VASCTVSIGPYPNRPIRVGIGLGAAIVTERTFSPGADVVLGADASAGLVVPGWLGPNVLLISQGTFLHLAPKMRLVMCDEDGGHRVTGTYEELQAQGVTFPISIPVSRLNIRLREGTSAYVHFLA
jgi:hypothetical protein